MFVAVFKKTVIIGVFFSCISFSFAQQQVKEPQQTPAEWSQPYEPFRIAGNLYYVGTYDLASYLVVSEEGHILINTGLASSEAIIRSNIETLGFHLEDIKILLTTQAHYDHMGAMAAIKKATGAQMMVDQADAEVMADGGRSDYALGGAESAYEPVQADRLLQDRDTISLGGNTLMMLHHPGHTKGSCSFLFNVRDEQKSYRVLIANLPSIVTEKDFSDIPAYPHIEEDYRYTLDAMKELSFDIWLASHASQFNLHQKHRLHDPYRPMVFKDQEGYNKALTDLEHQFLQKVR